jgi:hypothetical protein
MSVGSPKGSLSDVAAKAAESGQAVEMRNMSQMTGTDADEHEMRMLGRVQQLNVS